jgi:hypothetical protein
MVHSVLFRLLRQNGLTREGNMRITRMLAFVLAASCVLGAAAVVPAAADASTPTSVGFGEDTSSVNNPPSLTNPSVDVGGALLNAQGNTPITLPEPVTITEQVGGKGPEVTVAQVTTDGTGNFDVAVHNLVAGGIFTASFAGDQTNGYAASSASVTVNAAGSDPTIALASAPKSQVVAGSVVTFAGKAYVDDGGINLPLPDAIATIYRNGAPTSVTGPVKANGSFSLSVKPTGKAQWWVEVDPVEPWPYALYLYGTSPMTTINVVQEHQTRVAAITVPVKREVHSPFKLTGTVQAKTGKSWTAAAGITVGYYYRVLPKGRWVHVANGKTNRHGAFALTPGLVKLGHLRWQVKVAKQQIASTIYQASSSGTKGSFFVDSTYVNQFVALHFNGLTDVAAIMTDYPPSGGENFFNVTGASRLYYRPTGSKNWRYLGSCRVGTGLTSGDVEWSLSGTLSGTFKIVFPAQGDFLGSSAEQSLR